MMWHPPAGGETRQPSKARYALLALGIFLTLYLIVNWQADRAESRREKRLCEMVHGAGLCVESGGEWVPFGG